MERVDLFKDFQERNRDDGICLRCGALIDRAAWSKHVYWHNYLQPFENADKQKSPIPALDINLDNACHLRIIKSVQDVYWLEIVNGMSSTQDTRMFRGVYLSVTQLGILGQWALNVKNTEKY